MKDPDLNTLTPTVTVAWECPGGVQMSAQIDTTVNFLDPEFVDHGTANLQGGSTTFASMLLDGSTCGLTSTSFSGGWRHFDRRQGPRTIVGNSVARALRPITPQCSACTVMATVSYQETDDIPAVAGRYDGSFPMSDPAQHYNAGKGACAPTADVPFTVHEREYSVFMVDLVKWYYPPCPDEGSVAEVGFEIAPGDVRWAFPNPPGVKYAAKLVLQDPSNPNYLRIFETFPPDGSGEVTFQWDGNLYFVGNESNPPVRLEGCLYNMNAYVRFRNFTDVGLWNDFEMVFQLTSSMTTLLSGESSEPMKLCTVDFLDNFPIAEDPTTDTLNMKMVKYYPSPEWTLHEERLEEEDDEEDEENNGSKGRGQSPVALRASEGTNPRWLEVKCTIDTGYDGDLWVRGAGSGFTFPATEAARSGARFTAAITSEEELPTTVKYFESLEIEWQARKGETGSWESVGTSSNEVYITLAAPAVSPLYHTLLHIGVPVAADAATEDGVFQKVWGEFKSLQVRKHERSGGGTLVYWGPPWSVVADTDYHWFIVRENGRCGNWATLLESVLKAVGVQPAPDFRSENIQAKNYALQGQQLSSFLIPNFTFPAETPSHEDAPENFPFKSEWTGKKLMQTDDGYRWELNGGYSDISVASGIETQGGNMYANAIFLDHAMLLWKDGRLYDPSYGKDYDDVADWFAALLIDPNGGFGLYGGEHGCPGEEDCTLYRHWWRKQ